MKQVLKFEQMDANKYRCATELSANMSHYFLTYYDKAKVFDDEKGYEVIIDVERSFVDQYKGVTTFPVGLMNFIRDKANKQGYDYRFDYLEPYILKRKLFPKLPNIDFETFQLKMLRRIGIYKRGILIGPTAMGKSIVLGGIIDKLNYPATVIITPTRTIFKQLYESFTKWFGSDMVGRVGQGVVDQKHITVCLYQSISKYILRGMNLKLVLIDEAHLINNTIIKFLKRCPNVYYRYGVTATPQKIKNNFVKTMQMIGYIGPIICEVTDKEAKKRVLPVKVKLVSFYCSSPNGESYQEVMRKDVLMSDLRCAKLLKAAYSEALSKGKTCLFLIDETEQGKKIIKIAKKMNIDITLAHGKMPTTKINKIIKNLDERKIKCVVATKVFGVGTDIPNVDCVVLGSSRKSEIDTMQKIGRGRRRVKGSTYLILIDTIDKIRGGERYHKYFYYYSIERLNLYKEKGWSIERLIF